jgi:hypothetical protein
VYCSRIEQMNYITTNMCMVVACHTAMKKKTTQHYMFNIYIYIYHSYTLSYVANGSRKLYVIVYIYKLCTKLRTK